MEKEFPTYQCTLIVDDVRQENSGKMIYIGVYADEIVFPPGTSFPLTLLKLCFVTRIKGGSGKFNVQFSLKSPSGQELLALPMADFTAAPNASGSLTVNSSPTIFPEPGKYLYRVLFDSNEFCSFAFELKTGPVSA